MDICGIPGCLRLASDTPEVAGGGEGQDRRGGHSLGVFVYMIPHLPPQLQVAYVRAAHHNTTFGGQHLLDLKQEPQGSAPHNSAAQSSSTPVLLTKAAPTSPSCSPQHQPNLPHCYANNTKVLRTSYCDAADCSSDSRLVSEFQIAASKLACRQYLRTVGVALWQV